MRVFILTLGTRGDFELFCTLGRELSGRGHHVVIGTSGFYDQCVRAAGLECLPVGQGTHAELVGVLRSFASVDDKVRRARVFAARWLRPQLAAAADLISAAGSASDYFISNLKLTLQRGDDVLPGAFVSYDPPDSVENLAHYGSGRHGGRILELVAMNRALVDPGRGWPGEFRFTGFWTPPKWEGSPSAKLANFLGAGSPPVVMTMGSMVTFDVERLAQSFAEALRLSGQRGVLVAGWSGLRPLQSADGSLLVTQETHYEWLFARAACVVHHGGVGTVAAVLRAGVPSILLPQIGSQEEFGRMLLRETLATGVFDTATLDPGALAAGIQRAASDEAVRESTRRWQAVVREERGVASAADLIEDHWRSLAVGSVAAVPPGRTA
jgi:UDP:flavonoid glycosyltransferase YjiC (YdhE family)